MLISTKKYLEKLQNPGFSGDVLVSGGTDLIITIPCYNEPDLLKTIHSLIACHKPKCDTEVIVLVNACEQAPESVHAINQQTYQELKSLADRVNSSRFKIIPHYTETLPGKQTGAGIPRKMLMDEALQRLMRIGNESGVIVSLDADCTVEENYLTEIHRFFHTDASLCSATLEFHHPVAHLAADDPLRKASEQYEKYLRYFRLALEYCGYPYAFYTIGSAMAFRASTYTRAGGMGKQAAGEDFYFLQKVFPLGKILHIDTTRVYPAARFSDRVPFGTGPALQKMVEEQEATKKTYTVEAFDALKCLFSLVDEWYKITEKNAVKQQISSFPSFLRQFLEEDRFSEHLFEIKSNVSSPSFFRKRFFNYFNAFKIVKYLNYVHPAYIPLREVDGEYELLRKKEKSHKS